MSIDVSKIQPGDEVTIAATAAKHPECGSIMVYIGGETANVELEFVSAHTSAKPPVTFEEYARMGYAARKRRFDEFVKPKRPPRTVEDWMREHDREPFRYPASRDWYWDGPESKLVKAWERLPADVWDAMFDGLRGRLCTCEYPSREAAVAALRGALLKLKLIDQ